MVDTNKTLCFLYGGGYDDGDDNNIVYEPNDRADAVQL